MTAVALLVGCLCGAVVFPRIVRRIVTGRWEGWTDARREKPPIGDTVLACMPCTDVHAVTYNGPDGGGDIPEDAELYWRPMPPQISRRRRARAKARPRSEAERLLAILSEEDGTGCPDSVALRRALLTFFERLNLGKPVAIDNCDVCGDPAMLFSGRYNNHRRCFGCCVPQFRS
jgi:hypothetical protein